MQFTWQLNFKEKRFPALKDHSLFLITAVLLLIAASRIVQLNKLDMDYDDAWSIWQTFGSPADIIRWTPFDWPPLFYLSLGAWKELVGIYPLVLRYFSVLTFLIGTACQYRVVRRLFGQRAAFLSTLAYAALGYTMYLSLFIRGYIFMLAFLPLAWWLTIRYFDRPAVHPLRRSALLAAVLAAMFYTHYTAFLAFALLGLYTLLVYPRKIWCWWLPVFLTSIVVLPQIIARWDALTSRTSFNRSLQLPPMRDAIYKLSSTFAGPSFALWIALVGVATVLIPFRRKHAAGAITLAVWVCGPVIMYLLQSWLGLFQDPRYMWWFLPGVAVWIGWGLSYLPRWMTGLTALLLLAIMFQPDLLQMYQPLIPFGANFQQLKKDIREGDAILIDPRCGGGCGSIETWDYFIRLYFPGGLRFISSPGDYRRIWYVAHDWNKDPATVNALQEHHIPGEFFGPSDFLFRLYEAPPDVKGVLFENGMRFHGAEIQEVATPYGVVYRAGAKIRLRLWWSVDQTVPRDYSIGIYFVGKDGPLTELNGPPQPVGGPPETSQWVVGRYYVEERELTIPYPIEKGSYTIYMAIVQWWDNTKVAAEGVGPDRLLTIQTINVLAW